MANSSKQELWIQQLLNKNKAEAPVSEPVVPESQIDIPAIIANLTNALNEQKAQFEAQQAKVKADYEAEQAKASGTLEMNELFSSKLTAAQTASAEIERQIKDEMAHANSRGINYQVTEADKRARINALFSDSWTEAQDARLNQLLGSYGTSSTQWTLPIQRTNVKPAASTIKNETIVGHKLDPTLLGEDTSTVLGG